MQRSKYQHDLNSTSDLQSNTRKRSHSNKYFEYKNLKERVFTDSIPNQTGLTNQQQQQQAIDSSSNAHSEASNEAAVDEMNTKNDEPIKSNPGIDTTKTASNTNVFKSLYNQGKSICFILIKAKQMARQGLKNKVFIATAYIINKLFILRDMNDLITYHYNLYISLN